MLLLTAQFLQPFKPSEAPSPSSSKGYFQVLQPELCGWVQVLVPTRGQGGFWSALSPLKLPGMLPQHPLFQAVVTETVMLVQEGITQGTLNGWEERGASVTPQGAATTLLCWGWSILVKGNSSLMGDSGQEGTGRQSGFLQLFQTRPKPGLKQ